MTLMCPEIRAALFYTTGKISIEHVNRSPDVGNNQWSNSQMQRNPTIDVHKLRTIMWNDTGKKYWTHEEREVQKGMESQHTSWNQSVIRKQSCPLSVQINISWFTPKWWPIKKCLISKVSQKKHPSLLCNLIVAKCTDGTGYCKISKLNVPLNTVGAIICK